MKVNGVNLYAPALADRCDKKLHVNHCNATPQEDGTTRVWAKIIDRFNYVHHVTLVSSANGDLQDVKCECMGINAVEVCRHCIRLAVYIATEGQIETISRRETAAPATPETVPATEPVTTTPAVADTMDADPDFSFSDVTADFGLDEASADGQTDGPDIPFEAEFTDRFDPDDRGEDGKDGDDGDDLPPFEKDAGFQDGAETGVDDADPEAFVLPEDAEPRSMEIRFGADMETGEPVNWYPNDTEKVFHTNMGIIGTMGTGKTQFTKSLVTQLYRQQVNNFCNSPLSILIFDYKGDYNETKPEFVQAVNAKVLKPYRIPYNPLALNYHGQSIPLLPTHRASMFRNTIAKNYGLGHKQQQLLQGCIMEAYQNCGIDPAKPETWTRREPTFEQVYDIFERTTEGRTPDSLTTVMRTLHDFCIFEANPAKACSLTSLLRGVVVIDLSGYDESIQNLVVAITLDQFYAQMQNMGSSLVKNPYRQLKYFILVDEADHFMSENFPSLKKIMKEGREFGVGTVLSTQSLKHFVGGEDDYSKYILTWDIHNVSDLNAKDIEYLLKMEQKNPALLDMQAKIKRLKKHESIVLVSDQNGISPLSIADQTFWQLMQQDTEN